jgi:predicted NACHT family NTPase
LLPILVPLASWSSSGGQGRSVDSLGKFIEDFISTRADPLFAKVINHAIDTGVALVLLDGLDEIESEDSRREILNGVSEFTSLHPGVKIILTTRPITSAQIPGFSAFEIQPWTEHQISQFVNLWSNSLNTALGLSADSETQSKEIMQAISSHVGLRELASNPLLLTLLAFVHRQAYRLPTRRIELYEAAVRTMLGSWDRARSLSHTLPRRFDIVVVERILSAVAFEMCERDVIAIERDEAIKIAQSSLSLSEIEVGQFSLLLDALTNYSAILVFRGKTTFSFVHRTFQEYFAAKAIAAMDDSKALAFITAHYFEPRFEEIIRLALSWMDVHGGRHDLVSRATEELINASGT